MNSVEQPRRAAGRPAGGSGARDQILASARAAFASHGFTGASMRAIAAAAQVDPALLHHHFGSKAGLFAAATALPVDPSEALPRIYRLDPDTAGERLTRFFLETWDGEGPRATFRALVHSASAGGAGLESLRAFFTAALAPLAAELGEDGMVRAQLVWSHLAGLAMARVVIGVEPITSTGHDDLVAAVAPTIQRYLTGRITRDG
jgi:AcrR family transcriptional regulator